jgi:hypothetical protein
MKKTGLSFFMAFCSICSSGQTLIINEVCSQNESINFDLDSASLGWISLYSPGPADINLQVPAGFSLARIKVASHDKSIQLVKSE